MSDSNQIQGRPIFCEDSHCSAVSKITGALTEVWPELGEPEHSTTDSGASVRVFTAMPDVEARVGMWEQGEIRLGLQVCPAGEYISLPALSKLHSALERRWEITAGNVNDHACWRITSTLFPEDLGGVREVVLREDLRRLREWVISNCERQQDGFDVDAARKQFGKFAEFFSPVVPWTYSGAAGQLLQDWADEALQLLSSGVNLAVPAESNIEEGLAVAAIADRLFTANGHVIGLVSQVSLGAAQLAQMAVAVAPAGIAVPARNLQMGSNPYQLGSEALNLLECLTAQGTPAVFFGALPELQRVFHGGQGAKDDPLQPAVYRAPNLPLDAIIEYGVARECRKAKTNIPQIRDDARREVAEALADQPDHRARRLTGQVAAHVVAGKLTGRNSGASKQLVTRLGGMTETLGGLSRKPRVTRSALVQQRMIERLTSPRLLPFLKEHLLGQDAALQEFHTDLIREVTTRPPHQPIRISSLGEPGTGKSQSLALLAQWLDVPYVNIDMASLPDPHMAITQLLGSGTGFVGSDQAGRLERVARHFEGAVVECSDLDHAQSSVQSSVGDVFLSIFETGEAQSGQGRMFSCANLIFAFTLNLPDGKDERMYERMGFGKAPTRDEVRKDVRRELKRLMSGAFWSRMGDPVLFAPLDGPVRTEIVRRAMCDAAETALARLGVEGARVQVPDATAAALLGQTNAPGAGFGARGLLELARTQTACAVLAYMQRSGGDSGSAFEVAIDANGQTVLLCRG